MKIAIDALGIHDFGGGRTATLNLLESLFSIDTDNEYLVFLSNPEPTLKTRAGNIQQYIVPAKNRLLLRAWAQLLIPFITRGFDIVHYLKNLGAFGTSASSIVTIYDLTILVHPELFPKIDTWYWKTVQKYFLHNVNRIIAISNNTANDLIRFYDLPRDRIVVIYPTISPLFAPAPEPQIMNAKQKYNLPEKYFIHVGRIDSKKNLGFLVQTLNAFRNRTTSNAKLVLVGEPYPKSPDLSLFPTIEKLQLQKEVLFTGKVPNHDLPALYSGAIAAVYPSLHEGFGLGPVEAMACGTPLIAHNAGAVREVVDDAGIVIEDLDLDHYVDALLRVTNDAQLRRDLRERGLERAMKYKGDNTARQTYEVYLEVAGRST